MKKLIFLFISAWAASSLVAQCSLPYKALSTFNNDTIAFITYNFVDRAESYKNNTLEDIYESLQIPIKYISESTTNSSIDKLYIYMLDDSTSDPIYICWEKEKDMSVDLPKYDEKIYEKYKNKKIEEIGIIFSNNKELKSSKNIPRGYIKNGRMVYKWKGK